MKTKRPTIKTQKKEIEASYRALKPDIKKRLAEFKGVWRTKDDIKLFSELCFCLLTPQSKAKTCWNAVVDLRKRRLLFKGSASLIVKCLAGVRFKNNKTKYIIRARNEFAEIKNEIRIHESVFKLRDWIVKNVCGMGYKEASHFLRNIGLGYDMAILDRHILKNLKLLGVIEEVPGFLSSRKYLGIEERMTRFSEEVEIPLSYLDLTLWAKETGEIFK